MIMAKYRLRKIQPDKGCTCKFFIKCNRPKAEPLHRHDSLRRLIHSYLSSICFLRLYVHSYQSYLWNHAASVRVTKYGADGVVVGDLIYCKDDSSKEVIPTHADCEEGTLNEADDGGNLEEVLEVDVPIEKNISVKVVDEEDLLKQKYIIEDIVLLLPSSRATYPTNDFANVYHDFAKKDNICLTESVHNVKEFSITNMTGGYREILKDTDAITPLADTDLDILYKSGKVIHQKYTAGGSKVDSSDSVKVSENLDKGDSKTVLKQFEYICS